MNEKLGSVDRTIAATQNAIKANEKYKEIIPDVSQSLGRISSAFDDLIRKCNAALEQPERGH